MKVRVDCHLMSTSQQKLPAETNWKTSSLIEMSLAWLGFCHIVKKSGNAMFGLVVVLLNESDTFLMLWHDRLESKHLKCLKPLHSTARYCIYSIYCIKLNIKLFLLGKLP